MTQNSALSLISAIVIAVPAARIDGGDFQDLCGTAQTVLMSCCRL